MENVRDIVLELVSHAKVDEALDIFLNVVSHNDDDYYTSLILITAQYNELNRARNLGMLASHEADVRLNNILVRFLDLINNWEKNNGLAIFLINENKKLKEPELDLSNCGIEYLPEEIGKCLWLKSLSLGGGVFRESGDKIEYVISANKGKKNNIKDLPESIKNLVNLKYLSISGEADSFQDIKTIHPLIELVNLEALNCDYTQIADLTPLRNAKKLKILSCKYSKIHNGKGIEELTDLETLDMASSTIDILPNLHQLKRLKHLNIEKTQISDLSPLTGLLNLEFLNCQGLRVSNWSPLIEIKGLKTLNLTLSNITNLDPIKNLENLNELFFASTLVLSLSPINNLTNLRKLDFSKTLISDLTPLATLSELGEIYASETDVNNLGPIATLMNLVEVNFSLTNIRSIGPISKIPSLRSFWVVGCIIDDCPADVWESGDARQLRAYFAEKQVEPPQVIQKNTTLKEQNRRDVKLILVGNSASGKTTLLHYLEKSQFLKIRNSTHGLEVKRWLPDQQRFPLLGDVAVSIWDFGGQEYYHGTYRLFMSSNAVYLLIWDKDTDLNDRLLTMIKDDEDKVYLEHFEKQYWLDTIRHYGGGSKMTPLIVVQNKTDNPDSDKIRLSQELHKSYEIKESFHVSLMKGATGDRSRESRSLRNFIEELEVTLSQKADDVKAPVDWDKIRQELLFLHDEKNKKRNAFSVRGKKRNDVWIGIISFEEICERIIGRKLKDDERHTLPRWLERGGVIAYFPDSPGLSDKIFPKPNILAKRIYEVLDQDVLRNNGVFTKFDIDYKENGFPDIFIEVAQRLELVFPHPDSKFPDHYIAPQYLPESHPIEDLFKIASYGAWEHSFWIRVPLFYYKKILHGLILHYIADKQVEAKHFWKNGIVFIKNNTKVLLKGLYPSKDEHDGKILIGVEQGREDIYQALNQELFFKCLDLISQHNRFNQNNSKITSISSPTSPLYDPNDEIRRILSSDETLLPTEFSLIYVSYDSFRFVKYTELLKRAKENETKIMDEGNKTFLLLKRFSPLLPRPPKSAKKVFLSYSHQNATWLNRLRIHLSGLRRSKEIETWTDQELLAGEPWDQAIKDKLTNADVFILLLSADFIASDYIWETELPLIFKKFHEKKAVIVPVLIEPHDIRGLPSITIDNETQSLKLGDYGIIPRDEKENLKAVSLWSNPEEALREVAEYIRKVIQGN